MKRTLHFAAAMIFAAAGATAVRAQNNQPAPSTASSAAAPATDPNSTSSAPAAQTPAKKVWTNDDVGGLRTNSSIVTFQPTDAKPAKPGAKPPTASAEDVRRYHDQIAKLEAQVPPLDDQIAKLHAALSGETVNDTRHMGVSIDDWRDQMTRLQQKRDDIVAKISNLQDQARHKGVPANAIP
jgi:hypothetical protein